MKKTNPKILAICAWLALTGAQCLPGASGEIAGGIIHSSDGGAGWTARNKIASPEGQGSLSRFDILDLEFVPEAPDQMLAATGQAGLYRSADAGQSWEPITTSGRIQAVAINPSRAEELAAARSNQLFFSSDGGQAWSLVYTNPGNQLISDVAFDYHNPDRLYATLITGEMLVSNDDGKTWSLLHRFDYSINRVYTHPQLEERLYVFSTTKGVSRTDDMGKDWVMITEEINSPIMPLNFIDLAIHPRSIDSLLVSTDKNLFMSRDGGQTWTIIELLAEATQQRILAIAWDPQSRSRLFYATPTVFSASSDLGQSWQTSPLPLRKLPGKMLVHPEDSSKIYISTVSE